MRKVPKKITKKLEQHIIKAIVAATVKAEIFEGFLRYDYQVDWSDFPSSLKLNAVFGSEEQCEAMQDEAQLVLMQKQALNAFMKQGVRVRDIRKLINFEVEADQ